MNRGRARLIEVSGPGVVYTQSERWGLRRAAAAAGGVSAGGGGFGGDYGFGGDAQRAANTAMGMGVMVMFAMVVMMWVLVEALDGA
jgi:hypothetical protein